MFMFSSPSSFCHRFLFCSCRKNFVVFADDHVNVAAVINFDCRREKYRPGQFLPLPLFTCGGGKLNRPLRLKTVDEVDDLCLLKTCPSWRRCSRCWWWRSGIPMTVLTGCLYVTTPMPKMVVFDADSMMLTIWLMTPKKTGKSTNQIVKSILTVAAAAALTMIDSQTSSSIAAERVLPPPNIRDLFLSLA